MYAQRLAHESFRIVLPSLFSLIVFAIVQLAVCLPLNLIGLAWKEDEAAASEAQASPADRKEAPVLEGRARTVGIALFALIMSLNSFVFAVMTLQLVPLLCKGHLLSDTVAILGSIDFVMGECDR